MKLKQVVTTLIAAILVVAVVPSMFNASRVSAASRAQLVEVVAPTQPFFYSGVTRDSSPITFGIGRGTLSITNLTLVNFSSTPQTVFVGQVKLDAGTCGESDAVIGPQGKEHMLLALQPNQTLVIPYPSALTFASPEACVTVEPTTMLDGGSIYVVANGFLND